MCCYVSGNSNTIHLKKNMKPTCKRHPNRKRDQLHQVTTVALKGYTNNRRDTNLIKSCNLFLQFLKHILTSQKSISKDLKIKKQNANQLVNAESLNRQRDISEEYDDSTVASGVDHKVPNDLF